MTKHVLKKSALAVVMPILVLAALEGLLLLAGVKRPETPPILIRGRDDVKAHVSPTDRKVLVDPELLWAFVPGVEWDGITINKHGFRDRPIPDPKPPGVLRVLSIGDSCTAQGRPPYSQRLHRLLQADPPTQGPWEAFNMGVYGYSILQGLRQFQRDGTRLDPDVVTIYFGWNDHWLHERTDRQRMAQRLGPVAARLAKAVQGLRIAAVLRLGMQAARPRPSGDGKTFRVPESEYRAALLELVDTIRRHGAKPLIVTAPRRDLTDALVRSGHARHPDEAEAAHDRYVAITREVAIDRDVPLVDLARDFQGPEHDALFSEDGIHFNDAGLETIAQRLHEKIKAAFGDRS